MNHLPHKVCTEIAKHSRRADWPALSRTCRLFYGIAQELIYMDITILNPLAGPVETSRDFKLVRTFADHPGLCRLVRFLRVASFNTSATRPPVWGMYRRLIPPWAYFRGLRALTLSGFHIDLARDAIFALPNLEYLCLESCTTEVPPAGGPPRNTITELSIRSPASPEGWTAFAPPDLQSFVGDMAPGSLLSGLVPPRIDGLTRLTWRRPNALADVIHFLGQAPQLLYLSFCEHSRPNYSESTHLRNLPAGALPNLAQFTGPAEYAGVFVGGRPVRSATLIFSVDTPPDALSALRFSSVPVTELTVYEYCNSADVYVLDAARVLPYAPRTLRFLHWEGSPENVPRVLSHMTALRVLELLSDGSAYDGGVFYQRKREVATYSWVLPSLREIVFLNRERWMWLAGGSWERYILEYRADGY